MASVGRAGRWGASLSVREDVNQRIYELSVEHPGPFPSEFLCECREPDCPAFVTLDLPGYEAIRRAGQLVLAPGHQLSE